MSEAIDQGTVLVIGGRGKTGARVADRLEAKGVDVRLASRASSPAFNWTDRSTWPAAIAGARAAYIVYYPDLATPGAVEAIRDFSALAIEHGMKRLVLLSGRGEPEAQAAEEELMRSGADWTVVRASWFAQNFSESLLAPGITAGEVHFAADKVLEPFIDADDIADVAVAALTEPGHEGKLYEVTGPRLMTFADAVEEIASATGRPVTYTPLSADAYLDAARGAGVPEDLLAVLELLIREVLDGRNEHLADGVQQALGRPPRDFAEFARKAAADGLWEAA
ncbi:NAD(P)H-binding protein [Chelativorans sp. ZYF759]|uniref:NAD(P)H-binding protein n=1 Tax=Chelativorans sp. ZYF759 TaxID=2692213 RepID=UPI00145E3B60|nr:NAD(P)H-binding protein [Chelativorans sp. ZYF759]NMG37631.1 NAD(P)H-binding protein [Chelativorans sp. ZYF759]